MSKVVKRSALVVAVGVGAVAGAGFLAGWSAHEWLARVAPSTSDAANAANAAIARAGAAPFIPDLRVDATPDGPCRHDQECAIRIQLVVEGNYRLAESYPYRFTPSTASAANIELLARKDFQFDDPKAGVLPVRFRLKSAGNTTLAGVVRLAICDEAFCEVESAPISIDVAAL